MIRNHSEYEYVQRDHNLSFDMGFTGDLLDISVEEERKSVVIFHPDSLSVTSVSPDPCSWAVIGHSLFHSTVLM